MSIFKKRSESSDKTTSSPEDAAKMAFNEKLKTAKSLPSNESYRPFNEVFRYWGAKLFYHGSIDAIRDVVLQNLIRISQKKGFSRFRVDLRGDYVVQINASFSGYFVPVQIWKTGNEYFTSGNGEFTATGHLANDSRILVETTEKYEAQQQDGIQKLIASEEKLVCHVCGNMFSARQCQISQVTETYVIFICPHCKVNAIQDRN